MVSEFRQDNRIPVVLMGTYDSSNGVPFYQGCQTAVDGLIIADLPPEHNEVFVSRHKPPGWTLFV